MDVFEKNKDVAQGLKETSKALKTGHINRTLLRIQENENLCHIWINRRLIVLISLSIAGNPLGGVISLIYEIIAYSIAGFIIMALLAIIYNFLQPKISGFKLNLRINLLK